MTIRNGGRDYSVNDCQIRRAEGLIDDPSVLAEESDPALGVKLDRNMTDLKNDVKIALAALSEEDQKIVRIVLQEGKSLREAARQVLFAPSTAKKHLKDALEKLEKLLDAYNPAS